MNQLTNIFKLLSDETRLRMMVLLYQEELCVCELSGVLEVPQPRVSKNLSKLRDMNLVADNRKEKFVFYKLKDDNQLLMETLQSISDKLDTYPQLVKDRQRLGLKEEILNNCCIDCD
ncbi:MAG TPA: transcriptional regulator [Clostridiales bacterium]|nr:transcriptional regulator [Clostridiales bacterium]